MDSGDCLVWVELCVFSYMAVVRCSSLCFLHRQNLDFFFFFLFFFLQSLALLLLTLLHVFVAVQMVKFSYFTFVLCFFFLDAVKVVGGWANNRTLIRRRRQDYDMVTEYNFNVLRKDDPLKLLIEITNGMLCDATRCACLLLLSNAWMWFVILCSMFRAHVHSLTLAIDVQN